MKQNEGAIWFPVAKWFLALSYAIGAPLTAVNEYRSQTMSQRFDYPPELIYLTCAVQLLAVFGLFVRRLAPLAAAALTLITVGAFVSHLRIGSPLTSLPAVLYSLVQVWFGLESRVRSAASKL